jgi:hypothetical protein
MAKALWIKREDLVRNTALGGNIDTDKFLQFIKSLKKSTFRTTQAPSFTTRSATTSLPVRLPTLTWRWSDYLQPMVIHWAAVEYIPFAAYTIANGGVFKHSSENSTTAEKVEVDYLVEKERNIAQYYTDRFITYMSYNQATFPEYYLNSNADVYPDTDANFASWVL